MKNEKLHLEALAKNMMNELGVSSSINVYKYVIEAITIAASAEDVFAVKLADLYEPVAIAFRSAPGRVEQGVRRCIETAWDRDVAKKLQGYFGSTTRPTDSEFILTIAAKVRELAGK